MKRVLVLLFTLIIINVCGFTSASANLSLIEQGEKCLQAQPPEYEKAAQFFRRAGLQGDGEGYYRLGLMYEDGKLVIGDPCTEDLSALGKQKAEEYYKLAAQAGYELTSDVVAGWRSITQEEAAEMMGKDDEHVVVDVRRQNEYDAGHIPGAVLVPNESINDEQPEELPNLDQIILIYCRSGNRSKQAAEKLAAMGYTNVYEFGGINTWTGEIVTENSEK